MLLFNLHIAHVVYLCVSYGSHKQQFISLSTELFIRYSDEPQASNSKGSYCRSLKTEFLRNFIYKNPVRTSQETHYITATKSNRLMLFGETVAVYCEIHTEHTNTLCGQNVVFWYVKVCGT
jgi:hypothetical protein